MSRSWNCTDSRWARYWSVTVRMGSRARSISLVRQRCSSRSSGPSNDSTRTVSAGRGHLGHGSSLTASRTSSMVCRAIFWARREPSWRISSSSAGRAAHRSRRSRMAASGGSMCSSSTPLQSRQPMAAVRQPRAHSSRGALGREDAVQVEHRAHVGIAGVGAPLARGIGDHRLDLLRDDLRRVGELDGVAVGLGHLAAVRARHLGDLGELGLGLGEHRLPRVVEAAGHLAGELDVGHLVGAHRHPVRLVHEDVGGLEQRVAEEAVGRRLDAELLHHLLVGGHALEPAHRDDHREEQVQLRVLRHPRLDEQRATAPGSSPAPSQSAAISRVLAPASALASGLVVRTCQLATK